MPSKPPVYDWDRIILKPIRSKDIKMLEMLFQSKKIVLIYILVAMS